MGVTGEEGGSCEVCGAPAARRCSACRLVAYCSREHQKQHWRTHKDLCRPFEERKDPTLGRHLVATRALEASEMLLSEAPLVAGPRLREPSPLCPGCLRTPDPSGLARCPRCLLQICGPSCPVIANHQAECTVLSLDPQPLSPPYSLLTPLRCLLLQRRRPQRWAQLLSLEAHMDQRGSTTQAYKEVQENVVTPLRRYLSRIPEGTLADISQEIVHRVCGILDVNAMEVRGEAGAECIAVYPTACIMEHSCIPNSRHVFDVDPSSVHHLRVNVYASQPIARGDHITTMYTHALWGTTARRAHLRETKYFNCICSRCADPSELGTNLSGLRCLGTATDGEPCGGIQLAADPLSDDTEWRCNHCPAAVPSAHVEEMVSRLGEEVYTVLADNPKIPQMQALVEKLLQLLHPHHFHVFSVLHSLVQLLGSGLPPARLQWKAEQCRELLGVCRALDPGGERLALYSAVLQLELSRAVRELAERGIQSTTASAAASEDTNATALSAARAEAQALLSAAERSLAAEPRGSPGARYADIVIEEMRRLDIASKPKD